MDLRNRPLLAALLLVAVSGGAAWVAVEAGWPREQALIVAILAATVILWVTEALPLFATAFISIAAQLMLLGNPGGWWWLGFERGEGPPPEAFLTAAADPVLVLFFSGLVLSRAATTSGVDRHIAALVLRPLADSPARLLAGVVLATSCFSLWMSNTATTALMLALIGPVIAQLSDADPFRKALILAVPISANVAGMSTPISSPPNAIAVSSLAREGVDVHFLDWMLIACPIAAALLAGTWWWLLRLYPASGPSWQLQFPEAQLSRQGAWVVVLALVTLALWITESWHGVRAPIVAVLPITFFLATRVIGRDDINSLDWDVLILIAGGLTLGFSLQATGVDQRVAALVPMGASDLVRLSVLAAATLGFGTFFSNTAIASMLMPVAVLAAGFGFGTALTSYALTIALVASLSMALPVSTPPNAMAFAAGGITTRDFLRTAGVIGIAGTIVVTLTLTVLATW